MVVGDSLRGPGGNPAMQFPGFSEASSGQPTTTVGCCGPQTSHEARYCTRPERLRQGDGCRPTEEPRISKVDRLES